jgi:glycosyltransferase involved in cell wall biosynthesis
VNLLLINYEYPPAGGGAGNATRFIARALHGMGHKTVVMTASTDGKPGIVVQEGVIVRRIPSGRRRLDCATKIEMISFVAKAWRAAPGCCIEDGIEAVIVFFTLPCGPVALHLRQRLKIPYLVSLRGGDVPGLVPEIKWQHRILGFIRRRVLRSARAIVANDVGLARLSEAYDPYPVNVVHNGVDCDFFRPSEPRTKSVQERNGPTRLLFVGRLHRQKNIAGLIEQLSRLDSDSPGCWHLTIAGDGPERPELEQFARQRGIERHISWRGWLEKPRLLELYQEAAVLVNPSSYEGMPNVVLEAMACALPVVASDIPGNDTLVIHGTTGYLFALGNPDDFGAALSRIREDPVGARQMGSNGRERVRAEFSWTRVAERYLELLSPKN